MSNSIRSEIVRIGKMMYEKNLVNAFEGNISVKQGERIFVTPTGICNGFLSDDMLVVVDENGEVLEGSLKPTTELGLHLECYRLRPDIASVVHTHSPFATGYAIANLPITSCAYPEMIVAFDQIPVVAYGTPSTSELCSDLGR